MNVRAAIVVAAVLALAGASGFLASTALSQGGGGPTRTVTVDIGGPGPPGPPGPAGPPGPSGAACSPGFTRGVLVLNAPGGQTTLETCLAD